MKRKLAGLVCVLCLSLSACAGRQEKAYHEQEAAGGGIIRVQDDEFEMKLQNIFSGKGVKIDYLADVEVEGDCELSVDSSAVNIYEPGEYRVVYTAVRGNISESETIIVTIREEEEGTDVETGFEPEPVKSEEILIDSGVSYPEQQAQTARITLLSGAVMEVKCTTKRYITSTRTDVYNAERKGKQYQIKQLVIVFNTGEEQVLETVQKKID